MYKWIQTRGENDSLATPIGGRARNYRQDINTIRLLCILCCLSLTHRRRNDELS